ncbi:hypothetical protein QR685DRAFT_534670 [Neurospora intermedia]|uniref:Uncharacterized protein n=1 Tax=Neurospora intermedia TaxID=5142 RepID=A0ABR3D3N9_NEUIN
MATKITKTVLDNVNKISLLVFGHGNRGRLLELWTCFCPNFSYLPCTYIILLLRPSPNMPLTSSPPLLSIDHFPNLCPVIVLLFPLMFVRCHCYVLNDANPNHLLLPYFFFFIFRFGLLDVHDLDPSSAFSVVPAITPR